jgi:diguanylate cyclase (GGDEF)-like protein
MAQAARHRTQVAVLLIDLDGFKHVNDTRGHEAGDLLLRQVAARLKNGVRGCDTVSRYGGDEFVVLLPEVAGREGADRVAAKIRALLCAPFSIHGTRVALSASIGIALHPGRAQSCAQLIAAADVDMYRDKARPTEPMRLVGRHEAVH